MKITHAQKPLSRLTLSRFVVFLVVEMDDLNNMELTEVPINMRCLVKS